MKRRNIGFLVFMLAIGFATISTTLIINGNVDISFDDREFSSNIIFTKANTPDGVSSINQNGTNISFSTHKLSIVGDKASLYYDVANKNREYDASVTIKCGLNNDYSNFNDYLSIDNDLTSPFYLKSGTTKSGKLTIELEKSYTEDIDIELTCTLEVNPLERENIGDEYPVYYKDPILNGADPVLDGDKLIPITLASDGTVKYADINKEWYNYSNKEWANAVILVDNPSQEYNVTDIIEESDIESYFVWIPRYRYQIFDTGNYTTALGTKPSESNAKEIQIVFEGKETAASTGSEVGDWLTHPAFTNYNTNGIWVGKFETGYAGATSVSSAQVNAIDATKVIIKPNVYSWRNITVSNIFKTALAYEESLTSHMMRNTEWGAVAYLSHSKYGINDEVRINNNSNFLTGYAANEKDASYSPTNNSLYNTEIGYLASTTGNISGIYDMSGGAFEYVAGYRANTPGKSGFTITELSSKEYVRHIDVYLNNSATISYNNRILGDATGEMGPFYLLNNGYFNNWYDDNSNFIYAQIPWFIRGGPNTGTKGAGQFYFDRDPGDARNEDSYRLVLTL